jgi:hypothetical protein
MRRGTTATKRPAVGGTWRGGIGEAADLGPTLGIAPTQPELWTLLDKARTGSHSLAYVFRAFANGAGGIA